MAKILDGVLPAALQEYSRAQLDQLIKRLQIVLALKVHTEDDASETEAVNYFLRQ
jgi:hypothetical protein